MASRSFALSWVRPLLTPENERTTARSVSRRELETMRSAALCTCPRSAALVWRSSNKSTTILGGAAERGGGGAGGLVATLGGAEAGGVAIGWLSWVSTLNPEIWRGFPRSKT